MYGASVARLHHFFKNEQKGRDHVADSKKFNNSSQHHDTLSNTGRPTFNKSAPPPAKSTSSGPPVEKTYGPGPKVTTHGGSQKNGHTKPK